MDQEFSDEDMAAVGRALMHAISAHAYPGWSPADCPSEIVGDLRNECDELRAKLAGAEHDRDQPSDAEWLDWPTHEGIWWVTSPSEAEPKIYHIVGKGGWIELWECPGIGRRQVVSKSQLRFQRVDPPKTKPLTPGE